MILFLFISGVALLFAALGGLIEILRRREPWRKSGRLALPFATVYGIAWLPIPDFIEAAGASIRDKASSAELTSLARSVVDSPPDWLKDGSAGGSQIDKVKWMGGTSPLDRLGLGKYAFLTTQKETLQFSWGSSLSNRWGLAISAAPGIKPELPNDVVKAVPVYPDVWVYTLIDY
ncbi:hypothetical protein [Luteolibacter luteus]|uniref:Uncharacterized protein n=1 Tax=Luteolibacter luteus TaxID=2728835 RepID=A0A858RCV2_9BACT|nr:hypothetical protein [Luteolibacter luteus]QJE94428.1 hypothetical protein HHL09_01045 [Luteolibacter luteus]